MGQIKNRRRGRSSLDDISLWGAANMRDAHLTSGELSGLLGNGREVLIVTDEEDEEDADET